jgi:hypothetical protein
MKFLIWTLLVVGVFLSAGCGDDGGDPAGPTGSTNHPPVIQIIADTSGVVGDTLKIRASAGDVDGDVLKYHLTAFVTVTEFRSGYFPDVGMDQASGVFWFNPSMADRPGRDFQIQVFDNRGGADTTSFSVIVN